MAVGVAELVGVAEEIAVEAIPLAGAGEGDIDLGAAIAVADRVGGVHAAAALRSGGGCVRKSLPYAVGSGVIGIVGAGLGRGGGCGDGKGAEVDGIAHFPGGAVGGDAIALQGPLAVLVDQGEDAVGGGGGHPGAECCRGVRG